MKIYILGNGGFSHEVFEQVFLQHYRDGFGGFINLEGDKAFVISEQGVEAFTYPEGAQFIMALGNKKWRNKFLEHLSAKYPITLKHFPNIYAPDAHISKTARVGIGNLFCSFSMLNANAHIGDFNCVNIYASINHDCVVGNHNVFSPYSGIMGYCRVGDSNFFGTHTTVVPKVQIGNDNTLSSGECLFDNMSDRQFFQSGIVTKKP